MVALNPQKLNTWITINNIAIAKYVQIQIAKSCEQPID